MTSCMCKLYVVCVRMYYKYDQFGFLMKIVPKRIKQTIWNWNRFRLLVIGLSYLKYIVGNHSIQTSEKKLSSFGSVDEIQMRYVLTFNVEDNIALHIGKKVRLVRCHLRAL